MFGNRIYSNATGVGIFGKTDHAEFRNNIVYSNSQFGVFVRPMYQPTQLAKNGVHVSLTIV